MSRNRVLGPSLAHGLNVILLRPENSTYSSITEFKKEEAHRDSSEFVDPRAYLESLSRKGLNNITKQRQDAKCFDLKEIKNIFKSVISLVNSQSPFSSQAISALNPLLERLSKLIVPKLEQITFPRALFELMNRKVDLNLSHSDNFPDELISIYASPLLKYKAEGRSLNFFDAYEQEFLKPNHDLLRKTFKILGSPHGNGLKELDYQKHIDILLNAGDKENLKNNYLNLIMTLANSNFPNLNIHFDHENNRFASSVKRLIKEEKDYLHTLNTRVLGTNGSPYNLLNDLLSINQGLGSTLAKPSEFRVFKENFNKFIEISEMIFAQV